MKFFRSLLVLLPGLLNVACTFNSVKPLPAGGLPSANRAVIVYGVQVEGVWDYAGFGVQIDEYDIEKQNITGNCFRFNRAVASVSSVPGPVRYFAFDVPPGHYGYSPFHATRFAGDFVAFEAPPAQIVYLGIFRFEKSQVVSLSRNLEAVRHELNAALPGLKGQVTSARASLAKRPRPFLCAP
ncbi:hypothetical protein LK542_17695 [Massilia sp. IC2-477]|uniref:hypothetical protein n=1 Tax=Massilia sp. IC2-477 TaxID=2887198 RepID=UPI001D0F7193|nr:hypothetical protein [Massilia sp. IC2-477]MCC2957453.1 hypothetical protein [Massilia sp. IC2-477]